MKSLASIIAALAIALLASCGGGGGSYYHIAAPKGEPDLSGVVWSEYQGKVKVPERFGWIKGWVNGDRTAVTCSHANPAPGARIYVVDRDGVKVERTVVKVSRLVIAGYSDPAYTHDGDTSILTLDEDWPETVTRYKVATRRPGYWNILRMDGTLLPRLIEPFKSRSVGPWLVGRGRDSIEQGESGLPWFNAGGEVVSHTTKAWHGEGPNYADPSIRPLLTGE